MIGDGTCGISIRQAMKLHVDRGLDMFG